MSRTWQRPGGLPPEREWRTQDGITCLECGRSYRALGAHILQMHGITADRYRHEWGMSIGQPLVCLELSARRAQIASRPENIERLTTLAPEALQAAMGTRSRRGAFQYRPATKERLAARRQTWAAKTAAKKLSRAQARLRAEGHDPDAWLTAQREAGVPIMSIARDLDLSKQIATDWLSRLGLVAPGPGVHPTTPGTVDPTQARTTSQAHAAAWDARCADYAAFRTTHHRDPSARARDTDEARLGTWVGIQRKRHRRGDLLPTRGDALTAAVPGWESPLSTRGRRPLDVSRADRAERAARTEQRDIERRNALRRAAWDRAEPTLLAALATGAPWVEALAQAGTTAQAAASQRRQDPGVAQRIDDALVAGRDPSLSHGEAGGWRVGCRCPDCKAWKYAARTVNRPTR